MENLLWLLVLILASFFGTPRAEANGTPARAPQVCRANPDCAYGYECFLEVCVESQCHVAREGANPVTARGCRRGTVCIYDDAFAARHGNGFCDTP